MCVCAWAEWSEPLTLILSEHGGLPVRLSLPSAHLSISTSIDSVHLPALRLFTPSPPLARSLPFLARSLSSLAPFPRSLPFLPAFPQRAQADLAAAATLRGGEGL